MKPFTELNKRDRAQQNKIVSHKFICSGLELNDLVRTDLANKIISVFLNSN